jgi:hypothetical protein
MTGRFDPSPRMPKIQVRPFQTVYDSRNKRFELKGRLVSDVPAHSAVAIDIPEKGPGEYWKNGYATRIAEDGTFELAVDELLPSSGVIKLVFCFDNGLFTGTGKGAGFPHAVEVPYAFSQGRYRIAPNTN